MELPKLSLAALPQLATATGVYGSTAERKGPLALAHDLIIVMMVYSYR